MFGIDSIWQAMMDYIYGEAVKGLNDFFSQMNNMGADVMELPWVQAIIQFFTYFGWTLFIAGLAMAVFECVIESQNGKSSVRDLALNVIKGFLAVNLFSVVPVELFKFCVGLQGDLGRAVCTVFQLDAISDVGALSRDVLSLFAVFNPFNLIFVIMLGYCVIKCFFANIVRP